MPHRATLLGLPVGIVVAIELLAVAALLGWGAMQARISAQLPGSTVAEWLPWLLGLGALTGVALGILMLVPGGAGESMAGRLGRRLAFASARRAPASSTERDLGTLSTACPGLEIRPCGGGQRPSFAAVSWGAGLTAYLQVTPGPEGVPVGQVWASLERLDVPVDALAVIAESDRPEVIVGARIRPADAGAALEARGGGWTGAQGALAAVLSAVASGCSTNRAQVRVLGVEEVRRMLGEAIDEPGAPAGSVSSSWRLVTAPTFAHVGLVATRWDPRRDEVTAMITAASGELSAGASAGAADDGSRLRVTCEVRAGADSRPRARVLAVATAPNAAKATRVADAVRGRGSVRARSADGSHLEVLQASLGLVDGAAIEAANGRHPWWSPSGVWLTADVDGLDSLAPRAPGSA